jgi:pimeloyl-ACP methyl ester carboxylesterase
LLEGNLPVSGGQQAILDSFRQCRNRLLGQGVDISAYTSAASAADIHDLLSVLGYEQFDLYSVSYGTRLALTLLRDYPGVVRSAVLDSAYPLEVNLYTSLAPNAQRAFEVFFGRCEQDPVCSASFPDLRNVFFQLVDQFDQTPLLVSLFDRGTERSVNMDGGLLVDVLFTGLYNPAVTASMPQMIFDVRDGEYGILRKRLLLYFQPSSALGMLMAVQCNEELPFDGMDTATAAAQGVQSRISTYYLRSIQPLFEACRGWASANPDPLENQPVSVGVPMLVLAGDGDPITPPAWGQMVAAGQLMAYFHEFPGNGHWVTRSSNCALQMALAFWNDPLIDPGWICQT